MNKQSKKGKVTIENLEYGDSIYYVDGHGEIKKGTYRATPFEAILLLKASYGIYYTEKEMRDSYLKYNKGK